jgi:hypothetical protein
VWVWGPVWVLAQVWVWVRASVRALVWVVGWQLASALVWVVVHLSVGCYFGLERVECLLFASMLVIHVKRRCPARRCRRYYKALQRQWLQRELCRQDLISINILIFPAEDLVRVVVGHFCVSTVPVGKIVSAASTAFSQCSDALVPVPVPVVLVEVVLKTSLLEHRAVPDFQSWPDYMVM